MKELDEARRKIDQIILRVKAGEMTREKARKQILNLKGDGWRIAIISMAETVWVLEDDLDPDNKRVPFRQVIWQAE